MLEICPTPNPTLNLPDSVDKCKTDIKTHFFDATVLFELPYMQIWAVLSNRSYTGFEPELLTSPVSYQTSLLSMKTHRYEAGCVMLTFKSISFQISQHINIVLKS